MYQILLTYQILMVISCALFIVLMIRQREGELSKLMLCIAFLSGVQNFGYLQEMVSTSQEEVMMAVKTEYLGGAFIGTFLLLFTSRYCGHRVKRWLQTFLFLLDATVLVCCWMYDKIPFYYTSVEFTDSGIFPHVILHRGFLYYIFTAVILGQILISLHFIGKALCATSDRIRKTNLIMLWFGTFMPLVGILINWSGKMEGFDAVPGCVAFGIAAFGVVIIIYHVFDLTAMAHENIIKTMDEAVLIVDAYGCFIEANDKAMEMFPGIEQLRQGVRIPTTDLERIIVNGNKHEYLERARCYEVHANKVWNNRVLAGYAIVFVDVTQSREQLKQMSQLKINAEKANQAKSEFLARMSHEIRTPINAVLGMNEIILRESKEEDTLRNAADIRSSAQTLLGIINDILDFSKIESGKMEIVPAEYDLRILLHDLINMTLLRTEEKGLKLKTDIDPDLPWGLYGDDIRLRQVLLNLLTNAVKYTKRGSITFEVHGTIEEESVLLQFTVRDTGIGIKKEDMPRLFSAFERIEENQNRSIEGTGLGMNITIRLLELMDSGLQVESEYEKGSTFRFELKQKIIHAEPIGDFSKWAGEKRQNKNYQPTFTVPDARILMVDDNLVNRRVFCGLLKQINPSIDSIGSGRECLSCVRKERYDLIFLDHMMPEMDGIETFERMKKLDENLCKDTPVIMLTANAISGAKEQYLSMGFSDFLAKPISQDKLDEILERWLPEEKIHPIND